jgi:hypothetical protein
MRWQAGPAVPASVADDVELATRVARHDQAAFEMFDAPTQRLALSRRPFDPPR